MKNKIFLKNVSVVPLLITAILAVAQPTLIVPVTPDATACRVRVINNTNTIVLDNTSGLLIQPQSSIIYHSTNPTICNPNQTSYVVDTSSLEAVHAHDEVVYTIRGTFRPPFACTTAANSCKFSDGTFGYLTTFRTGHVYCIACPPV